MSVFFYLKYVPALRRTHTFGGEWTVCGAGGGGRRERSGMEMTRRVAGGASRSGARQLDNESGSRTDTPHRIAFALLSPRAVKTRVI